MKDYMFRRFVYRNIATHMLSLAFFNHLYLTYSRKICMSQSSCGIGFTSETIQVQRKKGEEGEM